MSLLGTLPQVEFAPKEADTILEELIARYEDAAGVTLYPADPVRLFLSTIAYELAQQRSLIDYAAKMNLLAYAQGDYLDHLAAFVPVARLPATAAAVTVRFTLSAVLDTAVTIPAGTRVTPRALPDLYFATDAAAVVPAGASYVDCACTCTYTGEQGNGFLAGQVLSLVDPVEYVKSAMNVTTSAGGANIEDDESYRERIQLVLESLSVAGPINAYRYWALSASAKIADVSVAGPAEDAAIDPGNVYIYPLLQDGCLPDAEILQAVNAVVNADDIRPLTDNVHVCSPTPINFTLAITYWIAKDVQTQTVDIKKAVDAAITEWIAWQKNRLGRDINPSELIHRVVAAGAKRAAISVPAFTTVRYNQVAICTDSEITFGGLEDG
ncbi:MAG: baseplate J/gp47 family protein [Synergistaceae bacterium]|nr:baseplate J/gp47 family protein [Synergistaceae bacterium]